MKKSNKKAFRIATANTLEAMQLSVNKFYHSEHIKIQENGDLLNLESGRILEMGHITKIKGGFRFERREWI